MSNLFHLAIPVKDLKEAEVFYSKLGVIARRTPVSLIVNFFGHQLVLHHSPEHCAIERTMYPRHFGLVLRDKAEFANLYQWCRFKKIEFFTDADRPGFIRFQDKPEEHTTFFIVDPSNNLIEFKVYVNEEWIFAPASKI